MTNEPRFTVRDARLPTWREVYAQSYPEHRLSLNQFLGAMIEAGIAVHFQAADNTKEVGE